MDVGLHQVTHGGVDQPVPLQGAEAGETFAHHPDTEVAPAITGAFVADVQVAFVLDRELHGLQAGADARMDRGAAFRGVHGNTWRNGLTVTRA